MESKFSITLGADPEFETIVNEVVVHAPTVVRGKYRAQIGIDGGGAALELRPTPGKRPRTLANNLAILFKRFKHDHPNVTLSVKGSTLALGGHIHFGIKSINPTTTLLYMMDVAAGQLASSKNGDARNRSGYGRLSDYNCNEHGFEYRTPSSAIFRKPTYMILFVKILREIVKYYVQHTNDMDNLYRHDSNQLLNKTEEIVNSILSKRDKVTLEEFKNYVPSNENIIQYWI
jgi:hypothetical protein